VINFKRLAITDFKVDIGVGARHATVAKAFVAAEIEKKWGATNWARRQAAKAKRDTLNDFDRFKIMKLRKRVCAWGCGCRGR
jgi:large subunit ribosomal protein L14e